MITRHACLAFPGGTTNTSTSLKAATYERYLLFGHNSRPHLSAIGARNR